MRLRRSPGGTDRTSTAFVTWRPPRKSCRAAWASALGHRVPHRQPYWLPRGRARGCRVQSTRHHRLTNASDSGLLGTRSARPQWDRCVFYRPAPSAPEPSAKMTAVRSRIRST